MTPEATRCKYEYHKQWREKNKEKLREYYKQWRENNKEKVKLAKIRYWEKKAQEISENE